MSKESQTSGKRPRRSFTEEFKRDAVNLVEELQPLFASKGIVDTADNLNELVLCH